MKYIPKDLKAITQTSDAHGYRADNKQNILMGNIQLSYNKDLNEKHHIIIRDLAPVPVALRRITSVITT